MESKETKGQRKGTHRNTIIALVAVLVLVVGCCGVTLLLDGEEAAPAPTDAPVLATDTPAPAPTDEPTDTPTPEPTDTPTPTSTPQPTHTPQPTDTPTPTPTPQLGSLEVHVVDVGQGDAILILSPNGTTVLIDGGDRGSGIVQYLRSQGVSRLDLMVATHPHADHIGGLTEVLGAIPVDEVVTNGASHTTLTYERFLDAIIEEQAVYTEVERGDTLRAGSLTLNVLHPPRLTGHLNNDSIVLRLVQGNVAFLFTGDAERAAEQSLLASEHNLTATVLKVGHHGSRSSSTRAFLEQVSPEVAVYSCAADNPYGHPHAETLTALTNVGADVYGTDGNGTVVITTDGTHYTVSVQKEGDPSTPTPTPTHTPVPIDTPVPAHTPGPTDPPAPTATPEPDHDYIGDGVWNCPTSLVGAAYTGSRTSDKFHSLGCHHVDRIHAENRICFASRSAAVNYRYEPCGSCKP